MEHELDFSKYKVVVLSNNTEIIIRNFSSVDIENNSNHLECTGMFAYTGMLASNILGNSWFNLIINQSNILYVRDLFDDEKRIVRRVVSE